MGAMIKMGTIAALGRATLIIGRWGRSGRLTALDEGYLALPVFHKLIPLKNGSSLATPNDGIGSLAAAKLS